MLNQEKTIVKGIYASFEEEPKKMSINVYELFEFVKQNNIKNGWVNIWFEDNLKKESPRKLIPFCVKNKTKFQQIDEEINFNKDIDASNSISFFDRVFTRK